MGENILFRFRRDENASALSGVFVSFSLSKTRYAMRTCVCYLESIVGYVVLSYTVQILASLVSYGVMFVSQL